MHRAESYVRYLLATRQGLDATSQQGPTVDQGLYKNPLGPASEQKGKRVEHPKGGKRDRASRELQIRVITSKKLQAKCRTQTHNEIFTQ